MKMIKFDLQMKGVKVTSFDELQENFSADILPIFQTGRLAKWLMSRELVAHSEAIAAINKASTELQQLAAICRVLALDDDEEVLQFLLDGRQAAQAAQVTAATPAAEASDVETENAPAPSPPSVDWSGQDLSGSNLSCQTGSIPSAALAAVIGAEPVTRVEVIKKLYEYIKANNLQDCTNKRAINADDKLLAVFGKPQLSMFELGCSVGKHLG